MKIAVNRIAENPLDWIKVRTKQYPKLFFDSGDSLLGSRTRPISQAVKEADFLVIFTKIGFMAGCAVLFLLFAVGCVGFIKRRPRLLHIYLLPLFFVLIHLPMWIESRYLLPVMPFIFLIAVYGSVMLRDYLKRKKISMFPVS